MAGLKRSSGSARVRVGDGVLLRTPFRFHLRSDAAARVGVEV